MSRKTPRIEPTLFADVDSQEPIFTDEYFHTKASAEELGGKAQLIHSIKNGFTQYYEKATQLLRQYLFSSLKNSLIAGGMFVFTILVVMMIMTRSTEELNEQQPAEESPAVKSEPEMLTSRFHQVSFPDKFSLWATEYNGMVINWQADASNKSKIWDLASAEGDQSCEQITFNNGDSYRTLNVLIEKGSHYFANFSPLDTTAIVNNIAMRGSFKLCGYEFSLKGSQAALSQHSHYGDLLTY